VQDRGGKDVSSFLKTKRDVMTRFATAVAMWSRVEKRSYATWGR
jgi:hypothetical protein